MGIHVHTKISLFRTIYILILLLYSISFSNYHGPSYSFIFILAQHTASGILVPSPGMPIYKPCIRLSLSHWTSRAPKCFLKTISISTAIHDAVFKHHVATCFPLMMSLTCSVLRNACTPPHTFTPFQPAAACLSEGLILSMIWSGHHAVVLNTRLAACALISSWLAGPGGPRPHLYLFCSHGAWWTRRL